MNVSVNLEMVESLKNMYQASEAIILEMMPEVNWNSTQQVKKYFNDTYWMNLPDTKIETLKALRDLEEHTSDCFNDLTGLIELYKTKYILKNYLNCLLTHGSTGYVTLLEEKGRYVLPNHQPLPQADEIAECIGKPQEGE